MADTKRQLEDWLDDLCARFIINLPETDLLSVQRICFHVEEAQWFYEDFIRPLDSTLPSMSLRTFCLKIFAHCPLLSVFSHENSVTAFQEFMEYKKRIPVRGAIMLNESMDSAILVKGWKKSSGWSFPRGKIAHNEDNLTCAVREVYEETGYDIRAAGLTDDPHQMHFEELPLKDQSVGFYFIRGVPMNTHFEPQTRQEISKIQWWRLADLPGWHNKSQNQNQTQAAVNANKFFMVAPFLKGLKKFISAQRKRDIKNAATNHYLSNLAIEDTMTEEEQTDSNSRILNHISPGKLPDISSYEGAEAALSQLLKIQAPTQGLQVDVLGGVSPPAAKPTGEALLALLHGTSQPVPSKVPLHTPLDLSCTQPPVPKSADLRQQQPLRFSSMPSPPDFQIHGTMQPTPFSHQPAPKIYDQNFQNYQPTANPTGFPGHNESHHHLQSVQQHPQPYQPQLIHPQPLPPNVQRSVFGGPTHSPALMQSIHQHMEASVRPADLLPAQHPQFPGLHAPMVPQTTTLSPKLTSHSLTLLNAFKTRDPATHGSTTLGDLPLRRYDQEPSQSLSTPPQELHAETIQITNPPLQPGVDIQQSVPSTLDARQPLSRPPISAAQKSTLLEMFKSPTIVTAIPLQPVDAQQPTLLDLFKSPQSQNAAPTHTRAPGPSDAQRSTLLSLFQTPDLLHSQEIISGSNMPMTASALPTPTAPSAVELSAVEPLTNALAASELADKTPFHKNFHNGIPQMNPEANLPFRATTILSRPAQPHVPQSSERGDQAQASIEQKSKSTSRRSTPNGNFRRAGTRGKPPAQQTPEKPFQPQILKRPQPSTATATEANSSVFPASPPLPVSSPKLSYTTAHDKQALLSMFTQGPIMTSPVTSSVQAVKLPSAQPSSTGEHTSKLLSLFGNTATAANPLLRTQSKDGMSAAPPPEVAFDPASRSRVGSLVSGVGESRRGSQTPISPADKGFLLNYLDNVTKGSLR